MPVIGVGGIRTAADVRAVPPRRRIAGRRSAPRRWPIPGSRSAIIRDLERSRWLRSSSRWTFPGGTEALRLLDRMPDAPVGEGGAGPDDARGARRCVRSYGPPPEGFSRPQVARHPEHGRRRGRAAARDLGVAHGDGAHLGRDWGCWNAPPAPRATSSPGRGDGADCARCRLLRSGGRAGAGGSARPKCERLAGAAERAGLAGVVCSPAGGRAGPRDRWVAPGASWCPGSGAGATRPEIRSACPRPVTPRPRGHAPRGRPADSPGGRSGRRVRGARGGGRCAGCLTWSCALALAAGGRARRRPALDDGGGQGPSGMGRARRAALVAGTSRVQIQLPGADPSVALGPDQAAALLRDFMAPAEEVETETRSAREVEPGRGYVELQRKYRVSGHAGRQDSEPAAGLPAWARRAGCWWS